MLATQGNVLMWQYANVQCDARKRFAHSAASGNFVHIALNCTN